MANFDEAFKLTGHNEGGYSNNKSDHGGETFAGIARNFWPNWSGWKLIDLYKQAHGINGIDRAMFYNPAMVKAIADFYKKNFWDVNSLDLISNQQIADNIYDCGVNSGTGYASKVLQQAANVVVDGEIGPKTIAAVNNGNPQGIYNAINNIRKAKYQSLAANPGQLQFLKSWMSRIKPYAA